MRYGFGGEKSLRKHKIMKKKIGKGDVVRIRHNKSFHGFKENTLGVVKECFPKRTEFPDRFRVVTRIEWWYVDICDVTLFKRNPNECDDWY